MKLKNLVLTILILIFFSGCSQNFSNNNSKDFSNVEVIDTLKLKDGTVIKKIMFKKTPEKDLKLNLIYKNSNKKLPAIIVFHGGGWKIGTEDDLSDFGVNLAKAGYLVITPTYRFSDQSSYPSQVDDAKSAYSWIIENAEKYNIDTNNIGVYGGSAGAYLSLMIGLNNDLNIRAVISQYGPTNFETMEQDYRKIGAGDYIINAKKKNVNAMLGQGCDITSYNKTCRIFEVDPNPIKHYDINDPPLLILQGNKDTTVPYFQSIELNDYGKKIGQDVELILMDGLGHDGQIRVQNLDNIIAFYDKHLKNNPSIVESSNVSNYTNLTLKKSNFGHYILNSGKSIDKSLNIIKDNSKILGVQQIYSWKQLEPTKGNYDFSKIKLDLNKLSKYSKKLVLQLQIKSFRDNLILVPNYLLTDEYGKGVYTVLNGDKKGTNAVIWNENLQNRYELLLEKLGKEFDKNINFEAIVLVETAISSNKNSIDLEGVLPKFTTDLYLNSIENIMISAKNNFPNSNVIQYINFIGNSKNNMPLLYNFAKENNVGIGGPDIYVTPGPLLKLAYDQVPNLKGISPIGYAIQWNDYTQINKNTGNKVSVQEIYNYAEINLKPDYYFWLYRNPYFENEVLPLINSN